MKDLPEKDWKQLSKLKDRLIQRFCDEILIKVKPITENKGNDSFKAYQDLWEVLEKVEDELSLMFDDIVRSNAFLKLALWRKSGLLLDEEFDKFTHETRDLIISFISKNPKIGS